MSAVRRSLTALTLLHQVNALRGVSQAVPVRGYTDREVVKGLTLPSAAAIVDELTRRGYQIVRVEESETP